jgi:hypothetical protein
LSNSGQTLYKCCWHWLMQSIRCSEMSQLK